MLPNILIQFGRSRLRIFLILSLILAGCGKAPSSGHAPDVQSLPSLQAEIEQARAAMSPVALEYIEAALDTIQALHPIGPNYDWEEWHLAALERAQGSSTYADTYRSLGQALTELPGGHSSFRKPPTDAVAPPGITRKSRQGLNYDLGIERVGGDIGLIKLPGFLSQDTAAGDSFAVAVQRSIRQVDADATCGWVVDIRHNGGGNMWPMLAGLGPILGEGHIGSVALRDDITQPWHYEKGQARLDTLVLATVKDPYVLKQPGSPVAVLISEHTGSSGEAVAVAFKGRPQTTFFGSSTAGATSSPTRVQLRDGAEIGFAGSFLADRNGRIYRGPIEPDVRVEREKEPDQGKEAALQWLLKQPTCRKLR